MSKLRILVPIKRVLDYTLKPRIKNNAVDLAGLKMSMNPFCEIAVEESLRIREAHKDVVESVVAVSCGGAKTVDVLRTAMAMGADRSIHVKTENDEELEPLAVAKILQKLVERENANLVLLGKQAIDNDLNQTGQMLAALMDWPQATCAAKVELDGTESAQVTREVDGGVDIVKAKLPMVITTDLRLNQPRFATLPNIMKAKKKPVDTINIADLGLDTKPRLETVSVSEPPARKGGDRVKTVDEFISKLKEAKAI